MELVRFIAETKGHFAGSLIFIGVLAMALSHVIRATRAPFDEDI